MTGPIRGAALPMAFNRQPHYTKGLLLVGDAGGLVNPFNGEGIAYAMESGQIAADVIVQAHARATPAQRELALQRYPQVLKDTYGGYYTLGRAFVKLIGNPKVMKIATAARPDAPDADEVHAEDAGQPDRPDGRRRDGPHHQRPEQGGPEGVTRRTALGVRACRWAARPSGSALAPRSAALPD